MTLLLDIENLFKKNIDINEIELNLRKGLINILQEPGLKSELSGINLLDESNYSVEFSGIKLAILNTSAREPYFRARLDIIKIGTISPIAWYEQEYDSVGKILDDFFDWK